MFQKIKLHYDGYHFASVSEDIYNPFSLLNAFGDQELNNYWFDTGTPSFLIRQMQHFNTDIMSLDRMEVPSTAFDLPTESMDDALPLLYQAGYITIKDYDKDGRIYTLAIPNQEVKVGLTNGLLPVYIGLKGKDVQTCFALKFWRALRKGDVELAMREMKAFMAGIPYVEGFKKKLEEVASSEGFYEYTMYLIFSMLNVYAKTQVKVWSSESHPSSLEDGRVATELGKAKCAGGRADLVVWMPDTTYVFELRSTSGRLLKKGRKKVNGTAQEALAQIDKQGYAFPYHTGGRRVVKVGVKFNADTRVPEDWVIDYSPLMPS